MNRKKISCKKTWLQIHANNKSRQSLNPVHFSWLFIWWVSVHHQLRIPHIKEIKKLAATKSRHLSTEEVETDCPSAKENGQMFLIDIQTFVLPCLTIALAGRRTMRRTSQPSQFSPCENCLQCYDRAWVKASNDVHELVHRIFQARV